MQQQTPFPRKPCFALVTDLADSRSLHPAAAVHLNSKPESINNVSQKQGYCLSSSTSKFYYDVECNAFQLFL